MTKATFTVLSDITPKQTLWLWKDRIPLGELTLFDGDPATNKSSVSLELAARVSTGRDMPDGSKGVLGGVVLLLGEDSIAKAVVPRLLAVGADLSRIVCPNDFPKIPDELPAIETAIEHVHAKLLVIDPLNVFLGKNANSDQAVRQALAPLADKAGLHNFAVVMIRHLNKSVGQRGQYRGLGSVGIIAAARSRFLFGVSPDDKNMRVMVHTKSNLGPLTPSLLYEPVGTADGIVRVEWRGESEYTEKDLLAAQPQGQIPRDEAKRFLQEKLATGPLPQKEVEDAAIQRGISVTTLDRAKREMKVISDRKGFGPGSVIHWRLADDGDHTASGGTLTPNVQTAPDFDQPAAHREPSPNVTPNGETQPAVGPTSSDQDHRASPHDVTPYDGEQPVAPAKDETQSEQRPAATDGLAPNPAKFKRPKPRAAVSKRPRATKNANKAGQGRRVAGHDLATYVVGVLERYQNGLKLADIVAKVLKDGYQTKANTLDRATDNALRKLVKDGRVLKDKATKTYRLAPTA